METTTEQANPETRAIVTKLVKAYNLILASILVLQAISHLPQYAATRYIAEGTTLFVLIVSLSVYYKMKQKEKKDTNNKGD